MKITHRSGITLVEILVTVLILTIGILSCLLYFSTAMNSTETARDMTVATTHAEYILEEMRSRVTLSEITDVNWTLWAVADGLNTLPRETVSVVYVNPTADPLNITVSVNWSRRTRANSISLQTELTK
jgi:Tfp pilus assembly protein PilV